MNSETTLHITKAIMDEKINALVFDFDGTIYESIAGIEAQLRPLMVQNAAKVLGTSKEIAQRTLAEYRKVYRSSVLGLQKDHGVAPEEFLKAVYDALDISKMVPRDGLESELRQLGKKIPLTIFTNSNRTFTHRALGVLGLEGIFDVVMTVEDNNYIRKPEREAYEGLYRRLEVVPEKVAMFDDIASSLKTIKSFGSTTVLVGNGLRNAPYFVDLHTGEEHLGDIDHVDVATHDLVGFLRIMNSELV